MLTKTTIALAAIIMLGAGSLAQASNENNGGNSGGYVLPGSTAGVNPVDHRSMRGNARNSYGYVRHYKHTTTK